MTLCLSCHHYILFQLNAFPAATGKVGSIMLGSWAARGTKIPDGNMQVYGVRRVNFAWRPDSTGGRACNQAQGSL